MSTPSVLLAVETSGPVGSVALSVDGGVRARVFLGEPGGHAAALIPAFRSVLRDAGLVRGDLGAVVVGAGPGSFTGVRVAAAAAKGLATGLGLPLYAVSSFLGAVLTEEALPGDAGPWGPAGEVVGQHLHTRYVLFDARGDRLFTAAYRLTGEVPLEVRAPAFARLPEVLEDRELAGAAFCGDGAAAHAGVLQGASRVVLPPPLGFPSADGLLRYMAVAPEAAPLARPDVWEPDYLRASNAERSHAG